MAARFEKCNECNIAYFGSYIDLLESSERKSEEKENHSLQSGFNHFSMTSGRTWSHAEGNTSRTLRLPTLGGRERLPSPEQETEIMNMVLENNTITLEMKIENNEIFPNIDRRVLELEVAAVEHQLIFSDEVGFNLTKRRKRGRNIIGQRAIVEVPGQRGGNITMCAAITHHGVIHHHATLGPYNTAHLITFLDTRHNTLIPPDQIDGPEQLRYVVIWDNVSFHRAALVETAHPCFLVVYLPPNSPFLNPIEEFFSALRWKVYDRNPQMRIPLLQAMEDACGDIAVDAFHGLIRHARRYFPRCWARENIACDVDEGRPKQKRGCIIVFWVFYCNFKR
ncbi:hypothetical protein F2P81_007563 [Scophthalmus maximus]|uniref:Tc1-like transposase DDE domain-containing protein n=1 Tax=Scophthalmus maximus TaxID=52904 RepID=A0A6A4T4S2_SCOMX|nr:hypothetical protein F2P81_007563 [Scophthalmus maximus]